jgi:prepilin-type N-terminal cleavage/methylation domain-containing protein
MMLRNREGFTLIELLIVVVIIGILAAIALPKFGQTREAAYYTTLKADLNNLRSAQEMYYQTQGAFAYAPELTTDGLDYTASNGVTITMDAGADGQSWSATAVHAALAADEGCVIAFGDEPGYPSIGAAEVTTATEGAPLCTDQVEASS